MIWGTVLQHYKNHNCLKLRNLIPNSSKKYLILNRPEVKCNLIILFLLHYLFGFLAGWASKPLAHTLSLAQSLKFYVTNLSLLPGQLPHDIKNTQSLAFALIVCMVIFANFASQTSRKISTSIYVYYNENIRKITKLTPREFPHLVQKSWKYLYVKIMAYTVFVLPSCLVGWVRDLELHVLAHTLLSLAQSLLMEIFTWQEHLKHPISYFCTMYLFCLLAGLGK